MSNIQSVLILKVNAKLNRE